MRLLGPFGWLIGNLLDSVRNALVSLRRGGLDYVLVHLEGSYPERRDRLPRLPFPLSQLPIFPQEPTLEDLRAVFEALGADRRVRGVVLRLGPLAAGPATVQALQGMVQRLRRHGKQVVCWLADVNTWSAYLASACDQTVLPDSGSVFAAGLRAEVTFLKDALALLGVKADFEALREYKVGPDVLRRSDMSKPHREMLEAILDSDFEEVVRGIAEGRHLEPERVRALMDQMPLSAIQAVEGGLADAVLYEDDLASYLGQDGQPAPLLNWHEASRWVIRPVRWRRQPIIGVIPVEGLITMGHSRRLPPLPFPFPLLENTAGAETVTQALRAAEQNKRIAAVILYVDSPGGSALASDLIWREVRRLREQKPVVVLMGNQATSGGYYISAPASAIIAQPLTLTGSIGIWGGKLVTADLYRRLRIRREVIQRGIRAGFWAEDAPFSETERQALQQSLEVAYGRFKARVAEGRGMEPTRVEENARGRIWTGRQALERGLVDELGGFEAALQRAKRLAGLRPERWVPVVTVTSPPSFRLPHPYPQPQPALLTVAKVLQALNRERVWALPPWTVRIYG